jgi:hypothetical protein
MKMFILKSGGPEFLLQGLLRQMPLLNRFSWMRGNAQHWTL